MSVQDFVAAGLAAALLLLAGPVAAEPPADGSAAPAGLEKLRKKPNPSGPLTGGGEPEPAAKPADAKSLGHGPETGADAYTPGAPSGDRGARPETIGGGTRMKDGASSALDDIR